MRNLLVDLVDEENILIPKVFGGIDENNIIYEGNTNEYNCLEDSYIVFPSNQTGATITINGITIGSFYNYVGGRSCLPFKKGDFVEFGNLGGDPIKVFGVKYSQ